MKMLFLVLSPELQVSLTTEEPAGLWKREVQFREPHFQAHKRLTLVSQTPLAPYMPPSISNYALPVLKSNLQKAVRRGNVEVAIATTFQLFCQGQEAQTELFRRLPIILLEDTLLHPVVYPRWIWWMLGCAKGYSLSELEVRQLLADVAWITDSFSSPYRDHLEKRETPVDASDTRCALFCIWVRNQWGGTTGDMQWLQDLYQTWAQRKPSEWSRLSQDSPSPYGCIKDFRFERDRHGLPEAVDFHCCTAMLSELAVKHGVSECEIQEAIWWHRSEPNVRKWFIPSDHLHHVQTGDAKRAETRELFASLEHELEPYERRMWKPQKKGNLQTSLFSFLKPGSNAK